MPMTLAWSWVIACFTIGAFGAKRGGLLAWWSVGCVMWILHAWGSVYFGRAAAADVWAPVANGLSLTLLLGVTATATARAIARWKTRGGQR